MTRTESRRRMLSRSVRSMLALCMLFAYSGAVDAQSAASGEAFREGTRLARQGLNRAARRNYEAALATGHDEPLVHYNLGVTQYRTGNYAAAEAAFREAAADPRLAALASYNLGLVHRANGDFAAARSAFAAAAASSEPALRALGERALVEAAPVTAAPNRPSRRPLARNSKAGELSVSIYAGYGFDDNIYRAPSAPYIDLAKADAPEVTPIIEASGFVPVDLTAQYRLFGHKGDADFLFTYDLGARYYESEYANADDVSQELSLAVDRVVESASGRSRRLKPTLYFVDEWRSNYDPDDGLDRELDEENLEHRVAYRGAGLRFDYEHRLGAWTLGAQAQLEQRFHKSVPIVASYDQQVASLHTTLGYDIGANNHVRVGLRRYRRAFDERPARDLTGSITDLSPVLEYDYDGIDLGFERRFTQVLVVHVEGLHLRRTDRFEGYDDYTQTAVEVAVTLRPGPRFEMTLAAVSKTYDYPNAFAFDAADAGPKETEHQGFDAAIGYRVSERLSIWAEVESFEVTSSDLRAEHQRTRSGLGVRWRF